jgi:chemotaxis signal transduction protein
MPEVALAVATPSAAYLLPLGAVVELTDMLAVGPPSEAGRMLAGMALHRDEILPVYSLDVLLGEAAHGERSWEDRDWGGFVIAQAGGRHCVIGVKRIDGVVRGPDLAAPLDLPALLREVLPPLEEMPAPALSSAPATTARYLLVAIGGQACALPLGAVERVQAECRTVRAAGAEGTALVGIGAVEGRVLPVIDLRALLGFASAVAPAGYVVTGTADIGRLVLAVDRVLGFRDIAKEVMAQPPSGADSSVVAATADGGIWILSPSLITTRLSGEA